MKMRIVGWILLSIFASAFADSEWMPLNGKTWLFSDDKNRNIGTTMADVRANTVVMISYENGEMSGSWANLTGMSFLSVGQAVNEIMRQFRLHDHIFSRESAGEPDAGFKWNFKESTSIPESYNCVEELQRIQDAVPNYFQSIEVSGRTVDGKDVSYAYIPPSDVWFVEAPNCILKRDRIGDAGLYGTYCHTDENGDLLCRYTFPEKDVGNDQVAVNVVENTWCNMRTDMCVYEVEPEAMAVAPQGIQTWNFQIFPRIVWHSRNILDGQPIPSEWLVHYDPVTRNDGIKNNEKDALFMIEKSRNSSDASIKGWRDPVLSDSLSALISFQFSEADVYDSVIVLRDQINGMWDRSPWRGALLADRPVDPYGIYPYDVGQALLRIFAESEREIEIAGNINERCGNTWVIDDFILGTQVFEFQDTVISNEFVPSCTDDTPYGQPCAKEDLAYPVAVKRIKFRSDEGALDPSMAIWRDGCPDPKTGKGLYKVVNGKRLFFNRNETLKWLQETPPRCSLDLLEDLYVLYDSIFKYFKNDEDKTLAKAAWNRAGFAQSWIKRIEAWKVKNPEKAVTEWDHCETDSWRSYGWYR